jgi:hypothetical protein
MVRINAKNGPYSEQQSLDGNWNIKNHLEQYAVKIAELVDALKR